jgi:hypothetical protein
MATWRYMTEEEEAELAQHVEPPPPEGDVVIHIFEVVDGRVRGPGLPEDGETVEPGWFVRPVEPGEPVPAYEVLSMRVKMNGAEVELKPGVLVAALPPNYRELADGAA